MRKAYTLTLSQEELACLRIALATAEKQLGKTRLAERLRPQPEDEAPYQLSHPIVVQARFWNGVPKFYIADAYTGQRLVGPSSAEHFPELYARFCGQRAEHAAYREVPAWMRVAEAQARVRVACSD